MAVFNFVGSVGQCIHFGLSGDTKPSSYNGTVFFEMDTGKVFLRESNAWVEKLNNSYEVTGGGGGGPHATTHQNNGTDEISVAGLSGLLADAQTPASHTHVAGDLPDLDSLTVPSASVNFNGQQATNFRVENRTSDPGSPTTGQLWLRTDI